VLLINVLQVEGGNKSWVVFASDGEEYKFRNETKEIKDDWIKRIEE
jgi:hypothetical protein